MINSLDLRPDLAEALSTYDSKTDHGLLMIITTAFMPKNEFNVEAQLAFALTMTLSVLPTLESYDSKWLNNDIKDYLKRIRYHWQSNTLFAPKLWIKDIVSKSEHQAVDEAYLVLNDCQLITMGRATFGRFEGIIESITDGYAILPAIHPDDAEILRNWIFNEVIPYCAAGALPPFLYTINGLEPTAAALKRLLNYQL